MRGGQLASLGAHPELQKLVEVMAVRNDSEIAEEEGQWKVIGETHRGGVLRTLGQKARLI